MVTKSKLKAIEATAYYNEQKRLEKIKKNKGKKTAKIKEDEAIEAAKKRGIAKAKGKKVLKESKTKGKAKKVGGFLKKAGKWGLEQRAKNVAEQKKIDQKAERARKAAIARKKKAAKK